jgi:hypothetical protein
MSFLGNRRLKVQHRRDLKQIQVCRVTGKLSGRRVYQHLGQRQRSWPALADDDSPAEEESVSFQRYRDILKQREALWSALEEDLRSVADQLNSATTALERSQASGGQNRAADWIGQWEQHASSLLQDKDSDDTAALLSLLQTKVDGLAAAAAETHPELDARANAAAEQGTSLQQVSEHMQERRVIAAEALAQQEAWEAERQRRQQEEANRLEQEARKAQVWDSGPEALYQVDASWQIPWVNVFAVLCLGDAGVGQGRGSSN